MLRVEALSAWYGEAQVLRDVTLSAGTGEVVTLCGRNGAGKTTLLRCVMGLHPARGRVEIGGADVSRMRPFQRAHQGVGWVPDDRGSYATLSVAECLTLPRGQGWPLDRVYDAFPHLYQRRHSPSTKLSGGEQQMLALARVLRMGAKLLLCDEPTEGLSPVLVAQVGEILRQAKSDGATVLLVEQNLRFATTVADRHYLLASGAVVEELGNSQVQARETELLTYLGM